MIGNKLLWPTCLMFVVVLKVSLAYLTPVTTKRFPPPRPDEYSSPPTLSTLAAHASLGKRGNFRYKTGEFHASARGGKRVRLIQTYANYEVFGPTIVANTDNDGILTGETYGELATKLDRQIRNVEACRRNVKTFQNIAIRKEKLRLSDPNIINKDGRRIIYSAPNSKAKIAYKVEFLYGNGEQVKWPVYIFDACTMATLLSYNNIHNHTIPHHRDAEANFTQIREVNESKRENISANIFRNAEGFCSPYIRGTGGNIKTGRRTYNTPPYCLNMYRSGSMCTMKGTYVKVVDNFESTTYYKQEIVSFPCTVGYQDGINGAYGVANDALFFGEVCGEFFEEKYSMRALPYLPRMVVHYGTGYDNAFWDGRDMYFGDGRRFFYPLVAVDVISHELAHGVTTRNSDLVYARQSGGINEAFSDITGEATKYYLFGKNDWNVGSTIFKTEGSLRYFEDPTADGNSIKNAWSYQPLMDVHHSSGVFNHAFYNMVTRENMDIYDAYKCFLDANLNLWGPMTNFFTGACNVMQAAYDNGFSHRKVRRSFRRVGIPLIFCRYWAFKSAMRSGERRRGVLVRQSRNPILEIDVASKKGIARQSVVRVTAEDGSPVEVVVANDRDAVNVVARGIGEVPFPRRLKEIYVQLSSNSTEDVKTTVEIM